MSPKRSIERNLTPARAMQEDDKLDSGLRRLLRKQTESCSPAEWAELQEQCRLQVLDPGHYVAFRDQYQSDGKAVKLTCREVLFHSKSLVNVQKYISKLPEHRQWRVFLDYVD